MLKFLKTLFLPSKSNNYDMLGESIKASQRHHRQERRDKFIQAALIGILAGRPPDASQEIDHIIEAALRIADAMIERSKISI